MRVQPTLHSDGEKLKQGKEIMGLDGEKAVRCLQEVTAAHPAKLVRESELRLEGAQVFYNRVRERHLEHTTCKGKSASIPHHSKAGACRVSVQITTDHEACPIGKPPGLVRSPDIQYELVAS